MSNEEVCQYFVDEMKKQKEKEDFKKYDLGSITESLLTRYFYSFFFFFLNFNYFLNELKI